MMRFIRRHTLSVASGINDAIKALTPKPIKDLTSTSASILFSLSKKVIPNHVAGAIEHTSYWLQSEDHDHNIPCAKDGNQDPDKIVLYLIHGTADRPGAWVHFALAIKDKLPDEINFIRVIAFSKRGEGVSNEEFAKELADKISKYGDKKIIIGAHSRGGPVASVCAINYLCHPNTPKDSPRFLNAKVLAIIPVGSPYGGAKLASIPGLALISNSIKEMQEGSHLLTRVQKSIFENKIPHYAYSAGKDWIIPDSKACNPSIMYMGEVENYTVEFKDEGHLSILGNKGFQVHFIERLKKAIEIQDFKVDIQPDFKVNCFNSDFFKIADEKYFTEIPDIKSEKDFFISPETKDVLQEADELLERLKSNNHQLGRSLIF